MIVYLLLVITLLFALLSIFFAWRFTWQGGTQNLHTLALSLSSAMFIYQYGTWVFISVYVKYIFGICFIILLLYPFKAKRHKAGSIKVALSLFLALIFFVLDVLYFTGTTGKPYGVAPLALPFKTGNYFVFQGGEELPTNVFHYKLRGAVYAMDIVKLNSMGNRAKHIFSTSLQDYEIYNDTLYSPCDGRVVKTETRNPDNIPPSRKRGPSNTNYILLQAGTFNVFMAHLRPGCVFVHEGDTVHTGQPIACCGNSGFSLEPHLHIQAHALTAKGVPWYKGKPLMILFNDKFYRLFEVIRTK